MAEVNEKILVVRKPCFGLPTGCPECLSAYIYLHLAQLPFHLDFHLNYPDSDQIPYLEVGDYVAYNNEKEGVIECLKRDVDLDNGLSSRSDWIPIKAMLTTCLADALSYEIWVGCEEQGSSSPAYTIYYSDLPWPIRKALFLKKASWIDQKHGITNENAVVKSEEIYGRANSAYDALSNWLGEQNYLFESRPSSLDAIFLAHGLVVLQALPESSKLRTKFLEHANLVRYVQQCKAELEAAPPLSSGPQFHTYDSSSASTSRSSSKPKSKPKREKTQEEKTFKRRAKYFVVAQLVAVVVFLTLMTSFDDAEVEVDDYHD